MLCAGVGRARACRWCVVSVACRVSCRVVLVACRVVLVAWRVGGVSCHVVSCRRVVHASGCAHPSPPPAPLCKFAVKSDKRYQVLVTEGPAALLSRWRLLDTVPAPAVGACVQQPRFSRGTRGVHAAVCANTNSTPLTLGALCSLCAPSYAVAGRCCRLDGAHVQGKPAAPSDRGASAAAPVCGRYRHATPTAAAHRCHRQTAIGGRRRC